MKFSRITPFVISILTLIAFSCPLHAGEENVWWKDAVKKAAEEGYRLIDTSELYRLYKEEAEITVIDNRYEYEFEQSTILPGAVNVPFRPAERSSLDSGKKEQLISATGEDKERRIIFYCRSFR